MSSSNVRQVRLRWAGEGLVFHGGPDGGPQITVDSSSEEGLPPMHFLLVALAGCMAVDVRMILEKSRVPLESLEVEAVGMRADAAPRRFVEIRLNYRLSGPEKEHETRLQRAIDLSRDKYCSVLHTLDPEIDLTITVERA